jgi:hypothetical protein
MLSRRMRHLNWAWILAAAIFSSCSHGSSASPNSDPSSRFEPASGAVFVGCGFLVAEHHGATNFTVLMVAEEAKQVPDKENTAWVLDGVLVETTSASASDIGFPSARGESLLQRHLDWETKDLGKKSAWMNLKPPTIGKIDLGVEFPTMTWIVDATGDAEVLGVKIAHLLYVTAAIDDVVFVMAAPMRSRDELGVVGPSLQRSLRTLKKVSRPTDILKLSKEVRESPPPWKGCPPAAAK